MSVCKMAIFAFPRPKVGGIVGCGFKRKIKGKTVKVANTKTKANLIPQKPQAGAGVGAPKRQTPVYSRIPTGKRVRR